MRADANVANGDTSLAALMRETAAATVDTVLAELRRARVSRAREWVATAAPFGYRDGAGRRLSWPRSIGA